jgi:hypothetical protein
MEASKAWRDAWVSILNVQLGTVTVFEELYDPIVGASDGHGHDPIITPKEQLERTTKLKSVYADLKTDLLEEVVMMDSRIIRPAGDAKEFLQPLRKTIKKRENKRVDWERYIDKVNNLQTKKLKRTDKENAALAKAEEELSRAADVWLPNSFSQIYLLIIPPGFQSRRRRPSADAPSHYLCSILYHSSSSSRTDYDPKYAVGSILHSLAQLLRGDRISFPVTTDGRRRISMECRFQTHPGASRENQLPCPRKNCSPTHGLGRRSCTETRFHNWTRPSERHL